MHFCVMNEEWIYKKSHTYSFTTLVTGVKSGLRKVTKILAVCLLVVFEH